MSRSRVNPLNVLINERSAVEGHAYIMMKWKICSVLFPLKKLRTAWLKKSQCKKGTSFAMCNDEHYSPFR